MAESQLRGVINFFQEIGIYDVVLPFLLVFTIMFAIFEKTRVLGVDKINNMEVSKKNLNSMIAFVIAFLVVASTKLVAIVSETMSNIVLLVLLAVSFLMLVGVFVGTGEFNLKTDNKNWLIFFTFFMFIAIMAIFLQAIKTDNGVSWLEFVWNWIMNNANSQIFGSVILLAIILGFMIYVTKDPAKNPSPPP